MSTQLLSPQFYNPANAADWNYRPDEWAVVSAAADWKAQNGIKGSAADRFRLALLGIDLQGDFCFPQGSLFVAGRSGTGAVDDNVRICEFIYRNLDIITEIAATMDTHFLYQIFFSTFWLDENGAMPEPHTMIAVADVVQGKYRPNPAAASLVCNGNYAWLQKQVQYYCEQLELAGKYQLYLWPLHCLLGGMGHALAGVFQEARLFHSAVRGAQTTCEIKGGNVLTENYSVLRPEVLTRFDGQPLAQKNTRFLQTLLSADALAIVGQAASHCVASSIDDLLDEIVAFDPELARKVYVLTDCMSSVTVPDGNGGFVLDFTPESEAAFKRFEDAGMHLVQSTTDPRDWPGIKL